MSRRPSEDDILPLHPCNWSEEQLEDLLEILRDKIRVGCRCCGGTGWHVHSVFGIPIGAERCGCFDGFIYVTYRN